MFRQLFLPHLVLLLVTLAFVILFVAGVLRDDLLTQKERRLESQARMLQALWMAKPDAAPIPSLGRSIGSRLTVIDADGTVLADSDGDPRQMDNHNSRPEVRQARAEGWGRHVRTSDTVRYDMMYAALLDSATGIVYRSAVPLTRVDQEVGRIYTQILMAFAAIGALGALITAFLAHRIGAPLQKIRHVAQAIAGGNFSERAPLQGGEEVGSLAAAINRMSDELSSRMASLQAESTKLEAVISSMEDGVIAMDRRGIVEHCNALARRLFELSMEPRGLKVWELIRHREIEELAQRALEKGEIGRSQIQIGSRALSVGVSPIRGGQGAVLVASDVTEASRYDEMRKEFVANVSHELRTPLALIQGYVDTLQEGAWRDEQRAPEFLETIQRNIARLNTIVADLLQLSRLESGGEIIRPAAVRMGGLFEKLREFFEPFARKKNQALEWAAAADVDAFVADPDMIERAVSNLIDNAIKYTPEGGRIRVRSRSGEGVIDFVVEDTGIGIPDADRARVFERFYRVDKSRSRELGGTGLGLAIVKHIAQLHGGGVSVQSEVGQGSTFTLTIPLRR